MSNLIGNIIWLVAVGAASFLGSWVDPILNSMAGL